MLFDKDGHIKLADFGLSKILSSNTTTTTSIVGTDFYMAPEIYLG